MRKRLIPAEAKQTDAPQSAWLALESIAEVEITSEAVDHPIEAALVSEAMRESPSGWRAGAPGKQTIRLRFDSPLQLRRIRLVFEETARARTQEFVLRWSGDGGRTFTDIVRQQYNFAPPAVRREEEDYRVSLERVNAIELEIIPEISGGAVTASLQELRLA